MKPNFLVIGAPKAGTTSLCFYLAQHPDIFVSDPKEPHFFCDDQVYERGIEWYESLFEPGRDFSLRGEGTPFYSLTNTFPNVLPRIQQHLDNLKLVYMVRHPIERMESYYSQEIHNGYRVGDFCDAVRDRSHYVDGSLYHLQYTRYQEVFGAENIRVVFFEDFRRDTMATVKSTMRFLGADDSRWEGDVTAKNSRHTHRQDTIALQWIRQLPGFSWIERHRQAILPQRIRSALKKHLRRSPKAMPDWNAATLQWALDQVRDDSKHFLEAMGKPSSHWDLATSETKLAGGKNCSQG